MDNLVKLDCTAVIAAKLKIENARLNSLVVELREAIKVLREQTRPCCDDKVAQLDAVAGVD